MTIFFLFFRGVASVNAVYIMASRRHGTLYIGVTSNLIGRVGQHREGSRDGFTKQYGVKRLKKYKREWKVNLIEGDNPGWDDLFPQFFLAEGPLSHLQPREPSL